MRGITFIKLGGAILTDKANPCTIRLELMKELTGQIRECLPFLKGSVVIGNGGGSFGHYFAQKYDLKNGISDGKGWMGFCKGKNGNAFLHHKLVDEFLKQGIMACSYSSDNFFGGNSENRTETEDWSRFLAYLDHGILPIVYGDIIYEPEKGCRIVSTEDIFFALSRAILSQPSCGYFLYQIIYCTNRDGVEDMQGEVIPFIDANHFDQWEIFRKCGEGYDVTGGMCGKVKMAVDLKLPCPVYIVNGNYPERLAGLLKGEKVIGTCIRC